jgi:hypothetical protein
MSVQTCDRKRTFGKEDYKDVTIVPKWILKNWGLDGGNSAGSRGRLFLKFGFDKGWIIT